MIRFWRYSAIFVLLFSMSCHPGYNGAIYPASYATPKNVILVIADGMGMGQLTGSMYSKRKDRLLSRFPVVGLQKTHATDNLITDSAASGTAMACGVKTYVTAIGVNNDTIPVPNIFEKVRAFNMATGLVVSSSIVHATPACFYAHQPTRLNLEEIAFDLLANQPDFVVGGGRYYFGARNDGLDLIKGLKKVGYMVYDFLDGEMHNMRGNPKHKFIYFTAEREPLGAHFGRRYLPGAVRAAVQFLPKRSDDGFFLVVEASQVDWASHNKNEEWLTAELDDFRATVSEVVKFAIKDGNTLVVVTGDHETGGLSLVKGSKKNKPVYAFSSNDHTASMTPVLAMGPGAKNFSGVYENSEIFHKMWGLISARAEQQ